MTDGVCYQIYNSTTLYVFPSLSCTEGSLIPSTQSTTREIWYFNEKTKEFYKSSTSSNVAVNYSGTSQAVAHVWSTPTFWDLVAPGDLVLPACIIVLCLAKLLINMFMGVRR